MSVRDMNHWPLDEYPHLLHTLVFQAAIKIVKTKLRARGYKVHEYSLKELRILADAYLEHHRSELMVEQILKVRSEPRLLKLAEAEARRHERERPKPIDQRRALELLEKARKR